MTELELYKFIQDSNCLTDFDGEKAVIWIDHCDIEDFAKLLGYYTLSDGGIEVRLQEDYIAIEMNDICESNNIDMASVFNSI